MKVKLSSLSKHGLLSRDQMKGIMAGYTIGCGQCKNNSNSTCYSNGSGGCVCGFGGGCNV